jgi:hypothetical protein
MISHVLQDRLVKLVVELLRLPHLVLLVSCIVRAARPPLIGASAVAGPALLMRARLQALGSWLWHHQQPAWIKPSAARFSLAQPRAANMYQQHSPFDPSGHLPPSAALLRAEWLQPGCPRLWPGWLAPLPLPLPLWRTP